MIIGSSLWKGEISSATKDDMNISTTFKGLRSYAVEVFGNIMPFH
jgi:hypothetical protein